ncbi:hypothetical protein MSAN_00611600 [Mycena sanguinolenta]|uniref:Lysozyme n=1 Tax=Mycena sanguinolenta TaxID=230812 RepID=A0A8H6ZAT9_9AGAR|nr:hypothetical protein MSAN_00611600 [Mycena sanguinolenta]
MRPSAFFFVFTSLLLFPAVRTAPVHNSSLGDKCSENDACNSQPPILPNGVSWSFHGLPDEIEGHSVDVPRDSNNSLAGEADGSGADEDLLDIGHEVGFNNFDFEGGGDVDIAKNTGAAPTAQALLINDLIVAIQGVNNIVSPNVRLTLTDNQVGALASLLYTIGPQALRASRLIANLNTGTEQTIETLWLSVTSRPGVMRLPVATALRRRAEVALFLTKSQILANSLRPQCQSPLRRTPINAGLL